MNNNSTYQLIQKCIVFLLLIGQIWSSTIGFIYEFTDFASEIVEHSLADDCENEKEKEDNKKEKAEKIHSNFNSSGFDFQVYFKNQFSLDKYNSIHHLEISTPPPEFIS